METLQGLIDRLEQYGDRVAMQIGRGKQARRLTYAQLADRARALSKMA